MSNTYLIQMQNQTVAAAASTLLIIRPPTTRPIRLKRFSLEYNGTATSTQVRYQIGTKVASFPTVTAVTPVLWEGEPGATAQTAGGTSVAAGTCGYYASSEGAGTFTTLREGAFNCLNGLDEFLGDYSELILPAGSSSAFCLRFPASPGVVTNWTASIYFKEV
jgi:hypothetical protein